MAASRIELRAETHRDGTVPNERRTLRTLLMLTLLEGAAGIALGQGAELTGVVRDARGTPQLGVLVELLSPEGMQTALTDAHGRYRLRGVNVGEYQLRTSGPFFLPTTLRGIRVHAGSMPAINVVLTGLFDEIGALTPHTRAAGDSVTEWKWTLRSPSARPMLRLAEDTAQDPAPTSDMPGQGTSGRRHGTVRVGGGTGTFGVSRGEASFRVGALGRDAHVEDTMEITAGSAADAGGAAPAGVRLQHVSGRGQDVERRVMLHARTLPQVTVAGSSGLEVMEIQTAQRISLGSWAAMDLGGRAELAHAAGNAFRVRPSVRLTGTPATDWVVAYEFLSEPEGGGDRVPTVASTRRGLALVTGEEQAIRVRHRSGRAHLEAGVVRERASAGVVSGAFLGGSGDSAALAMVDRVTGTFRQLGPGYVGFGGTVAVDAPIGEASTLFARAVVGPGLALAGPEKGAGLRSPFVQREAPAVVLGVKRSIARSGTEAAVSYRWQPAEMLTTVGAYEAAELAPYLGVHLRQRLPVCRGEGGGGAELTVDASNVLGEGYHVVSGPGREAMLLMSALREIRAGVAVSF